MRTLSCCYLQRLREEFQTMNGDDLEENESEEETEGGNQLKKMIKSKTTHSIKKQKPSLNYLFFTERDVSICETLVYNWFEQKSCMSFTDKILCWANFSSCLIEGEIPDATMIHMIRKKRQQARDYGDFIPLDDTERVENSKSRLVRSVTLSTECEDLHCICIKLYKFISTFLQFSIRYKCASVTVFFFHTFLTYCSVCNNIVCRFMI